MSPWWSLALTALGAGLGIELLTPSRFRSDVYKDFSTGERILSDLIGCAMVATCFRFGLPGLVAWARTL